MCIIYKVVRHWFKYLDLFFNVKYNSFRMRFYKEKGENVMKRFTKLICLILALAVIAGTGVFNLNLSQFASAADSFELITGSTLLVDTGTATLRDLVPGITVGTVKGNFKSAVTVYNGKGEVAADSDYVGTGYTIKEGNNTLSAVIMGDINGDGMLSALDFVAYKQYMKSMISLSAAYVYAADVTGEGKIGSTDLVAIKVSLRGELDLYLSCYNKAFNVTESIPKYETAANAKAGINSTGTVAAGTYYVHKSYPAGLDGMYYLTATSGASVGFWIDPSDIGADDDSSVPDSSVPDVSEPDSSDEDDSSEVARSSTMPTPRSS